MHALRTLHLFAGAGGGILADILLGHVPVCAVEIDRYCQQVIDARQKDGCLGWFPVFDDVRTFDGRPWRGLVEIVAGGFPCQDISAAGKGAGIDGERSGLWREMARIIGEVRPRFVFVENSPMLTLRGLGRVLGDFSALGYDARWGVVSAADAGMDHRRKRTWIVASDALRTGFATNLLEESGENGRGRKIVRMEQWRLRKPTGLTSRRLDDIGAAQRAAIAWRAAACEPLVFGKHDVVADWMDRIKAIGNGQVPQVARLAWLILTGQIEIDSTQ